MRIMTFTELPAVWEDRCPACGDLVDHCQGHGPEADPYGARIIDQHEEGDHSSCVPFGCEGATANLVD